MESDRIEWNRMELNGIGWGLSFDSGVEFDVFP